MPFPIDLCFRNRRRNVAHLQCCRNQFLVTFVKLRCVLLLLAPSSFDGKTCSVRAQPKAMYLGRRCIVAANSC
ncbi:hypothetical protein IC582_004438 [Cucumis melo]